MRIKNNSFLIHTRLVELENFLNPDPYKPFTNQIKIHSIKLSIVLCDYNGFVTRPKPEKENGNLFGVGFSWDIWSLTSATKKSLKLMFPNYNNLVLF